MPGVPYVYPTAKTGTSQDLLSIVTRAYELELERTETQLPRKPDFSRLWLEAPFILIGLAMAAAAELAPADWVLAAHQKLFSTLASPKSYPFDADCPPLRRGAQLVGRLTAESGRAPALLALISHPPVMGDMAHMNFELVRHATLALRRLRGRPCRPRLIVAVDPFALDTISLPVEGLYAGFMGNYHLGLDRLAFCRNALSALLLRRTAWNWMPHRFIALLKGGGEAGMVLAGGVPATSRVLYASREWLARERSLSPLRRSPAEVLARLRSFPDFQRFEKEGPHGPRLAQSAWRMAEAWAMSALTGTFGSGQAPAHSPADTGVLTEEARGRLSECLEAFALSADERGRALSSLKDELARQTPYRGRLFRVLASRLLRTGRPLVILPIAHRIQGGLGIVVKDAWAWRSFSGGRLRAQAPAGGKFEAWEGGVEEFAARFGRENFS